MCVWVHVCVWVGLWCVVPCNLSLLFFPLSSSRFVHFFTSKIEYHSFFCQGRKLARNFEEANEKSQSKIPRDRARWAWWVACVPVRNYSCVGKKKIQENLIRHKGNHHLLLQKMNKERKKKFTKKWLYHPSIFYFCAYFRFVFSLSLSRCLFLSPSTNSSTTRSRLEILTSLSDVLIISFPLIRSVTKQL